MCGSRPKTAGKFIQDILTFLSQEAAAAEEEIKWEQKTEGSEVAVRLTLGGEAVEGRGETVKAAKEGAAMTPATSATVIKLLPFSSIINSMFSLPRNILPPAVAA